MDSAKTQPVAKQSKKPKMTIEQKIELGREKLRKLEKQAADKKRAANEKNQSLIFDLIKAKGLDKVSSDIWLAKIEGVKKALE